MRRITPNEMKKGMRGALINGWHFEVMDNRKGARRMLKVFGDYTETGDCFVWDIDYVVGAEGERVGLTIPAAYHKERVAIERFFG